MFPFKKGNNINQAHEVVTMRRQIPIFLFLILLVPVGVSALEEVPGWQATCTNTTYLFKQANIYFNNTLYPFNQTVLCQYGCDTGRNICNRWLGNPMPGEYFMLFQIIALAMFFIILYRLDVNENDVRIFDVALATMAVFMFFLLALQGNSVIDMSTGEDIQIIFIVYINMGLGMLSLIPFFFMLFKYIRGVVEQ